MATYDNRRYHRARRRKKRKPKLFRKQMRITVFIFFCVFLLTFCLLMVKIYWINQKDGDRYKKEALSQQFYTNTVLNFQRGDIKDRNNTTLAVSVRKYNMILEPRKLIANADKREKIVKEISSFFQIDKGILENIINKKPNSMYEHVDELRELSTKQVRNFKKKVGNGSSVYGVWFEEMYKRNYPQNTVGASIIGFTSSESKGTYGVEEQYNSVLNGIPGREYGYFDSDLNLQRTVKKAKDGNCLILTIDANVQKIVEEQIQQFQKNDVGAKNVAVMIMNPKNGEVLAMASNSSFDLNNPQDLSRMYTEEQIARMKPEKRNENLLAMWSNYCIGSAYEPGSTYKPFSVAAALDEDLVSDKTGFECKGVMKIADTEIHCSNRSGHGMLDLRHAMMESCNSAMMTIGIRLGRTKFSKYNKLYGFGQRTGIDLPGETSGLIHTKSELNPVELATSSFGQTQTVTMVQMLSGFSSLVNGGNYYQPHVVKEIQNMEGDVVETMDPIVVKRTTSEATSRKLRQYLKSTVEGGTASPAKVKGYSIGGKTGTAEKRPISQKKYLTSFIGCVPAENPDIVYYAIVDEPRVADQAHSTYATKFSSGLMKKVLPFLGQYATK